jgi:hypothetical protein
MRYRKIIPIKKRRRRLPKPPAFNGEAKTAIALAFAGLDGVEGLIKWAKLNSHNRGIFYSLFGKLIPLTMNADVKADVNVRVESDEQLRAALEQAFYRVIDARKAGIGTVTVGGVVIDADEPQAIDGGPQPRLLQTTDGSPPSPAPAADAAPHGAAQSSPAPHSAAPDLEHEGKRFRGNPETDRNVVPLRNVRSLHNATRDAVPGLYAGVAMEGLEDGKSSTQRFYEWNGHLKPP